MVFDVLISNVLPLYGLILLGFVVGKYTHLDVDPIATIMLYAVLPVVMFGATATMEFTAEYFVPPLIMASISIIASVIVYNGAGLVWGNNDTRKNILGLMGATTNAAYFGTPVALALAGQEYIGLFILMVMPFFIIDCTLGYYYMLRGNFHVKDSLIGVTKLPIIYGALFGFAVNLAGFEMPQLFMDYWERFTGTIVILGMMMVGAGIANMDKFRFDTSFFIGVALSRYIIWPALGFLWVWADLQYLHMLSDTVHMFIILICACPLAANTVAYAAKLNIHPALTSCMVLITTILALAFIPFMLWLREILF